MSERERSLIWFLMVFVLLLVSLPMIWLFSGWSMPGMMGMRGMMGYGSGFMFLVPIAFLALIGVGAYLVFAHLAESNRAVSRRGNTALEILNERYAKGEIAREEYLRIRKEIES